MATGTGSKTDLSECSVKDPFLFDGTCTPCTKEGLSIEAINCFCESCTKQHKAFGGTSDHNVVNRTLTKRPSDVPPSPVVRETCREHHGERLTTYCTDHDLVVCSTCVEEDHRLVDTQLCDGISCIPKVADGVKQSNQIDNITKQITESLKTNDQTKVSLQKSLKSADKETKGHHKRIHDYIERVVGHVRVLECTAINDVDFHYDIATEKVRSDIKSIDDASTIMKDRLASLNNAKTNSDAQLFVDFKHGAQEVESVKQLQLDVAPSATGKFMTEFTVNEDVEYLLNDVRTLGQFTKNKAFVAELLGEYDVHMTEDQQTTCSISDSCELNDGDILIADDANDCLKKLSKSSYQVTERLAMPSAPCSICRISDDEVAVTLTVEQRVQFVNVVGGLRLTRSFEVDDRCRGILCSRDEIFVVCGGFTGNDSLECDNHSGHIGVYDISGSPLHTIWFAYPGLIYHLWPRRIAASTCGDLLYVTFAFDGVKTLDRNGNVLYTISFYTLPEPYGICMGPEDNLLVCGYTRSGYVVQIGSDNNKVADLLTEADGIEKPRSILPLRDSSKLILTEGDCNWIRVYGLIH